MSGARVPVVVAGIVAMLAILASLFVNLASSLVPTDWIKCHRLLITGGLGVLTVVSVIVAAWQVRLNTGGNDLKPGQQNQDAVAGIDLDRDQNSRFGYSFAYPKQWSRRDPENADGNAYVEPRDDNKLVQMLVWASHYYSSLGETIQSETSTIRELKDAKVLQSLESGLHLWHWTGKGEDVVMTRQQIPGQRLKYEYTDEGDTRRTVLAVLTYFGNREIGIRCEAPTELYFVYEPLFNKLVAELRVLQGSSLG